MTTRRRFLTLSAAALALPSLSRETSAQAWPAGRPIRAICPFTAGSTIDILGRIVTDPLAQALGATIVVENRGGAGGSIGSAAVAKAEPDGYTLLINASAHTAAPAAYPNIAYDPARDPLAIRTSLFATLGINVVLDVGANSGQFAKHLRENAVFYVVLIAGGVLMVAPFVWMISTALKPAADQFSRDLIPRTITFENFTRAWELMSFRTLVRWILEDASCDR